MSAWKHDELMNDLAGYLRGPDRMVWEDMQLGPSGSPRPDVYTLQKSYSKPAPAAYECKVSRSDLRSDTTSGKWQSYLKFAGSVTFAVPDGLCTLADIPDGCGLIVRKAEVWRFARRPTVQRVTPAFEACMKLLIDGVSRVSTAKDPRPRTVSTWSENAAIRKRFGAAVEKAARDLVAVEQSIAALKDQYRYEYDKIRQGAANERKRLIDEAVREASQHNSAKTDLCDWLGLPANADSWKIKHAIAELKAEVSVDQRVIAADTSLAQARRTLEHALQSLRA